ncbi:LysR family transcriptional regulator [Martelella soudanensis]|uniref:LysR family transcriptional regulator n=1 Tax=unclassified Martelella TaxID=2629616 RepID=UPI0015DEFF0A|nr:MULTISPECIES: LysR family transcriptional regulator [unclassified Martelella]
MKNLQDLEVFAQVAATGSMSEAGRMLRLSPAVVSKTIRRLEEQLGVRLLQRTTRMIALTETGRGFYERLLPVLAGMEEAEAFVEGQASAVGGRLRISAPTSFGRMHIAPHLATFMNTHEALEIELTLSDAFVDIVADGYDLAVRIGELADSTLVARKLAPVRRVLCASRHYVERFGAPSDLKDLERHVCLPAHNGEYWRLDGPEGPVAFRPVGRLVTNSSEVIREAVLAGMGIALRSTWDIGPELSAGELVQVLPEYKSPDNVGLFAVYASRNFLPTKVRLFIDFLAALYGPSPYWDKAVQ